MHSVCICSKFRIPRHCLTESRKNGEHHTEGVLDFMSLRIILRSGAILLICLILIGGAALPVYADSSGRASSFKHLQAAGYAYLYALGDNIAISTSDNLTTRTFKNNLSFARTSGAEQIPDYQEINSDVIGWLRIPGTNIDYPVVQRISDTKNQYYLNRNVYGQSDVNGTVFADYEGRTGTRDQLTWSTVLYGHNWTNDFHEGSRYGISPYIGRESDLMFAQLTSYQNLSFAQDHQFIYYSTAEEEMVWQIFAVFSCHRTFQYYYPDPDLYANVTAENIVRGSLLRSEHTYDVEVSAHDDTFLILSTCSQRWGPGYDDRWVVIAKLLDPDETPVFADVWSNPDCMNYNRS